MAFPPFPLDYVRQGVHRIAYDPADAVELAFAGYRLVGSASVEDEQLDRTKVHAMLSHLDALEETLKDWVVDYVASHGGGGGGGPVDLDGGNAITAGVGSLDGGNASSPGSGAFDGGSA